MDILISAVGGQGALLASQVLGKLAQITGQDVKLSEIHGMSQRGGSVVTYVRYGEEINSPLIEPGTADVVLAFELLEGSRHVSYLKENGTLIINTQQIDPMPVITGAEEYPPNLLTELNQLNINLISADGLALAQQAGHKKTVNIAMLGLLAKESEIEKEKWEQAVKETVPEELVTTNLKAFNLGYQHKNN